jgi:UDP-galactopyranose mutase
MKKYDFVIVGSGFTGATFAREMTDAGASCLVIDKRNHIGGNCYTENIEGINVHVYGPHIFHTSNEDIWKFVNRFAKFNHFVYRPKVKFNDKIYSFPINLMTLYQLWGVTTPNEARKKLEKVTKNYKIENPKNIEEWVLSNLGEELYETFIYGYTTKQWKRTPDKLPASIIKRIPVRLTWDDNYYNDIYQGIPIGGYTALFEKMLQGIDVELNTDFLSNKEYFEKIGKKILYTGPIDQFYNYQFGKLEYRGLRFEQETFECDDMQGNAVINHTGLDVPWTRVIEHKHFEFNTQTTKTIITKEIPIEWNQNLTPYYPVNDEINNQIHQTYENFCEKDEKYLFAGRLAKYKYYDMHQAIGAARKLAKGIKNV